MKVDLKTLSFFFNEKILVILKKKVRNQAEIMCSSLKGLIKMCLKNIEIDLTLLIFLSFVEIALKSRNYFEIFLSSNDVARSESMSMGWAWTGWAYRQLSNFGSKLNGPMSSPVPCGLVMGPGQAKACPILTPFISSLGSRINTSSNMA